MPARAIPRAEPPASWWPGVPTPPAPRGRASWPEPPPACPPMRPDQLTGTGCAKRVPNSNFRGNLLYRPLTLLPKAACFQIRKKRRIACITREILERGDKECTVLGKGAHRPSKLHDVSSTCFCETRPHTSPGPDTRAEAQMRLSRLVKIWWVQKGGGRRERLAWVGAGRRARHWRHPRH